MTALPLEDVNKIAELAMDKLGLRVFPGEFTVANNDTPEETETETAVEEKTKFDVKLVSFDAKTKIKVIKEVRAIAGLGLKEAKEMVEGAPKVVMKDLKKEEAEELRAKLEQVGGTIEIV